MKRFKKLVLSALTGVLVFTGIGIAHASRNGTTLGNNYTSTAIVITNNGSQSICSGAFLAKNVLVTAAHCVENSQHALSQDIWTVEPGEKVSSILEPNSIKPEIREVLVGGDFTNTGGNSANDIAYIIYKNDFPKAEPIKVATYTQLATLTQNSKVFALGSGYVYETQELFSELPRKYDLVWPNTKVSATTKTITLNSQYGVACVGDSGGPIIAILPDKSEALVGVLSGISNVKISCGSVDQNGLYSQLATLAYPYQSVINPYLKNIGSTPVASPSASATPSNSSTPVTKPSASVIKKTIKCQKNKTIKKITGIKPKCPAGYKLIK